MQNMGVHNAINACSNSFHFLSTDLLAAFRFKLDNGQCCDRVFVVQLVHFSLCSYCSIIQGLKCSVFHPAFLWVHEQTGKKRDRQLIRPIC